MREKIFDMPFAKVYPLLIAKAARKGRSREEVDRAASWLTGYHPEELTALLDTDLTYGEFFLRAPQLHPERDRIRGVVCGVRVEAVEDPLLREIRRLDKLVDQLAKGRDLEKMLGGG